MKPSPERLSYRIDEVCDLTGIGRTTVYRLIQEGTLTAVRVRGRRLISASSVRRMLEAGQASTGLDGEAA